MSLRPYQTDLIQKARKAIVKGARAPCIVLPCGGGKSIIAAEIARSAAEKGNRILFLVHRRELTEQITKTFIFREVDMSMCSIMMVQTAVRRLGSIEPPQLIITDENHHSKSTSYKKIYEFFSSAYRIGITATPIRLDGSGLGDVNDILIEGVTAKWLIEHNYLAPYEYFAPSIADLTGIKVKHGDYETKSAEKVMIQNGIFGDVIYYYRQLADGKQAICYCVSVNHSKMMTEKFNCAGITAAHIDGTTPKLERDSIIEDFRKGILKILCNVDLISEGFDVPDCECAILLRPTQSLTLYIQQSMRCMRYKPGKTAIIIDYVGNYARFGMPDADRKWSLESTKKEPKEKVVT